MAVRSMTGFAQVNFAPSEADDVKGFALTLKSVNHRFFDLHLRLPSDSDSLEMKLRRLLKEKINRGHVDLTLSIERANASGMQLNRELVEPHWAPPEWVGLHSPQVPSRDRPVARGALNSRDGGTLRRDAALASLLHQTAEIEAQIRRSTWSQPAHLDAGLGDRAPVRAACHAHSKRRYRGAPSKVGG